MFNFRPNLQWPGLYVEPPTEEEVPSLRTWRPDEVPGLHTWRPDEVPGFRMDADGSAPEAKVVPALRVTDNSSVGTYNVAPGQPSSYTPVRWIPTSSGSYLSFWDDVRDAAGQLGEAAKAVGRGAYSLAPGIDNLGRAAGRATGYYGEEEARRFRQEMNAARESLERIIENPAQSARLAYRGASEAFRRDPMLKFHLAGRLGLGALLTYYRIPFGIPLAPLAMAGDTLHALEKGHDFIDGIGYGVGGTLSR